MAHPRPLRFILAACSVADIVVFCYIWKTCLQGKMRGLFVGWQILMSGLSTGDSLFAFCFRSCIILVRTPPLGAKGGWREGRAPPGLLRRQPHASIRKLESTPTPTGDVEILTPAGHTKEDSNTCKGNNPYAYLCTDTHKK